MALAADNLYVYLAGHGNRRGFYLGLDRPTPGIGDRYSLLTPRRLGTAVDRLAGGRRYRRMLMVIEACNAGVFGRSARAPGAALLAAAGSRGRSLSANYDQGGAVWLADYLSYRFQCEVARGRARASSPPTAGCGTAWTVCTRVPSASCGGRVSASSSRLSTTAVRPLRLDQRETGTDSPTGRNLGCHPEPFGWGWATPATCP